MNKQEYFFLEKGKKFISSLALKHQAKIKQHIDFLKEQQYDFIETKLLRGKVREVIVGGYRVIYFVVENKLFIVDVFKKSTQKTPKKRIEYAERLYKSILNDK